MLGYQTKLCDVQIGERNFSVRALLDRLQFSDPNGAAEAAGISSASWSLFGQVWPSGLVLARLMSGIDIQGHRILEIGCGLGIASLVLSSRAADVSASDHHPLVEAFLIDNTARNKLPTIPYFQLPWALNEPAIGRFNLLIASDVLYERGHAELLAILLGRYAEPVCEFILTDPGRGHSARLTQLLRAQGFVLAALRCEFEAGDSIPYRGQLLRYRRL